MTQTSVGCKKRPTRVMVGPVRMRRLFAVPLAVLAVLLAAVPAWADTWTVTDGSSDAATPACDATAHTCVSLRTAIAASEATKEVADVINVPAGTQHWFDLCNDKNIRCIRLFQDQSGWTPNYIENSVHEKYQPLCMGPAYIRTAEFQPVVKL